VLKNNDLGKEFYNWLIDPKDKVKLIDFEDISKNDFAIVDELPFSLIEGTEEGSFRPDINILIYVKALGEFIERDFINFRLQNSDTSIGGMIVCRTNPQAKKVYQWFKTGDSRYGFVGYISLLFIKCQC
jgi:hypothetical protein